MGVAFSIKGHLSLLKHNTSHLKAVQTTRPIVYVQHLRSFWLGFWFLMSTSICILWLSNNELILKIVCNELKKMFEYNHMTQILLITYFIAQPHTVVSWILIEVTVIHWFWNIFSHKVNTWGRTIHCKAILSYYMISMMTVLLWIFNLICG